MIKRNAPQQQKLKLDDVCRNYHGGNEQSEAANESIHEAKEGLRERIRCFLAEHPSTCDEIEVAIGLTHQTASARITELRQMAVIEKNGTRPTRSGRLASVWKLANHGWPK